MRVFSDFHHDDLYHSLHLLFEKRLGWELYCPCGPEWYTSGYWDYSREPRVVSEYLVEKKYQDKGGGFCQVENPTHEKNLKAVTFDQFKEMKFDILISSVPEHSYLYQKLVQNFQPKAKLIQQVGNEWKDVDFTGVRNFMVSCIKYKLPAGANVVSYHQEFDLGLFSFEPGDPRNPIKSFVNDLPHLKDWPLFLAYEKRFPEKKWFSFGLGCRDGNLRPLSKLVQEMKSSSFFFHAKSLGDGFGYIIHNAFALGRPPIIRGKWYRGRFAEALITDQVTSIDLDKHTFQENCQLIKKWSEESAYQNMSLNCKSRFDFVVNYEEEEKKIRKFLERLK